MEFVIEFVRIYLIAGFVYLLVSAVLVLIVYAARNHNAPAHDVWTILVAGGTTEFIQAVVIIWLAWPLVLFWFLKPSKKSSGTGGG